MKSFIKYITEANYSRFLKKNKNLNTDQRNEINYFFSKINTQAGSKIDWQNKKIRNMTYDDFENIILNSKSGRRKNLKSINIPGKKGEDYWPVKLKTKGFIANIPLNHKTANYMNSCKYGTIDVNYCIGWGDDAEYWDSHVIDDQELPVYIIDGDRKWVVIIDDGNHSYQVWDKLNQRDISKSNKEPIPGFSIKKELLNSRMKKVYDEIREDFYTEDDRNDENEHEYDRSDAINDYNEFISNIESAKKDLEEGRDEYYKILSDTYNDTLEYYENLRDEFEEKMTSAEEKMDSVEEKKDELDGIISDDYPDKTEDGVYMYKYNGSYWTMEQLNVLFDDIYDLFQKYESQKEDFEEQWNIYDDAYNEIDEIDDGDGYEMSSKYDDYEWQGDIPEEFSYEQNINIPHISYYNEYIDFLEYFGFTIDEDYIQEKIWSYIYEDSLSSAEEALSSAGLYTPEAD